MILKCVLLDASIVIEAHKISVWENLIERIEIIVSSIVAHQESLFYSKEEGGIPEAINLKRLIDIRKIKEISATQKEMSLFLNKFDRLFVTRLHEGEAESLSLIMGDRTKDTLYCSSDATAIQALAMIGFLDKGVSMETMLQQIGLQKRLQRQFNEKFFKHHLKKGRENYITGQGLK